MQVFRAGGRAWGTQFHPEVDAEMAPHWVRDAVKEQKHLGAAFAEKLRAETDERLPAYPAFCRRITENFVRHAPACCPPEPIDARAPARTHEGDACASPRAPVSGQPLGERGL